MRKKSPEEMERARVAKTARTLIRLKHSLAADEEINTVLPPTLAAFEEALARGEVKGLKDALGDILQSDAAGD